MFDYVQAHSKHTRCMKKPYRQLKLIRVRLHGCHPRSIRHMYFESEGEGRVEERAWKQQILGCDFCKSCEEKTGKENMRGANGRHNTLNNSVAKEVEIYDTMGKRTTVNNRAMR